MKKNFTITFLLIVATAFFNGAYADVQADLTFNTSVPQAAKIQKKSVSSSVHANPETGVIDGDLSSIFELSANDTDEGYDFIITSSVETTSGSVPAYDNDGNILFGNIDDLPTFSNVVEAMSKSGNNYNVISYPVTLITTSPFTSEYKTGYKDYGNCYVVKINGGTSGTITHKVGPSPVSGTFSKTKDTAGTYKVIVTMTASGI